MQLKWKQVMDTVFQGLVRQIDMSNIRPGTEEERMYLKIQATDALRRYARINRIDAPCEIKINWNPIYPDEISIALDVETTKRLKERNLYD